MKDDRNPWAEIPAAPPYVLPMDRPYVDVASALQTSDGARLHTGRMPEPRSGPRDAPVVVLQMNPSYEKQGHEKPLSAFDDARLRAALRDEYAPHIGIADAHTWWRRAVAGPIAHFGSADRVARGLCSIEFFPYPSLNFACAHLRLPSQAYQFQLVREALMRGALIIVTRGWSLWLGAIPELYAAHRAANSTVLLSRNPRRVAISPRNLPEGGYERVLAALESVPAQPTPR